MKQSVAFLAGLAFLILAGYFYVVIRGYLTAPEGGYATAFPAGGVTLVAEQTSAMPAEAAAGQKLFKQNCSSCHAVNAQRVGPALAGVNAKYAGEEEWLYSWIRNAPGMVAKGDTKAVVLWEQYNKQAMTAFPTFKDEEIASILSYVEFESGS